MDLNSRIGVPDDRICDGESLDYYECEDLNVNDNGKNLLMLCEENNVVVVNNLRYREKHFNSNLSFRKKNAWISEPDALVVSVKGLQLIDSFNMVQYFDGSLSVMWKVSHSISQRTILRYWQEMKTLTEP